MLCLHMGQAQPVAGWRRRSAARPVTPAATDLPACLAIQHVMHQNKINPDCSESACPCSHLVVHQAVGDPAGQVGGEHGGHKGDDGEGGGVHDIHPIHLHGDGGRWGGRG